MRARCEFANDLLMTAMDAIKDANRQPAILQVKFFQRMGVDHCKHKGREENSLVSSSPLRLLYLDFILREKYFLRLPFELAGLACDQVHQRNQFALRADAAHQSRF